MSDPDWGRVSRAERDKVDVPRPSEEQHDECVRGKTARGLIRKRILPGHYRIVQICLSGIEMAKLWR
ncbi:hypothetical protein ACC718_38580, partial [Rhizobium ruizarguesonis]